jgi:nitrogen fixation-related uncharacterized protein
MDFINSLGDGWTIYLWLVVGALIIAACIYGLRWASRNEQFDEDIKYLVFKDSDQHKMSPEDFKKSQEVLKAQEASRERHLRGEGPPSA